MPELVSRSDFQRVASGNGNIFFNQTTNKLDVRGGSFISRFVTWIKSKYNPNKVNQEHKMATDSFIREVERSYSEALGKYNVDYRTGSDDLSRLYELGKQNKPLVARQVRQALKNLDIINSTLADTQDYLSPQQCNRLLVDEMSKYPELAGTYTAGKIETEQLSSSIQKALMEEVYQHGRMVWETTGVAIAKDVVEKHVAAQLQTLTLAVRYSQPDYCQEQIVAKLSKDSKLIMRYYYDPADTERLSSNIQQAIVSARLSSKEEMTETKALAIAERMITEHTDTLIKQLREENAVPAMKPMSESEVAAEVKATKEDSAFAESTQKLAAIATAQKEAKKSAQKFVDPSSTSSISTEQATLVAKSLSNNAERLLKQAKDKKIQLSSEVKTQVRSGEIRSLSKLIKAHNQSVAKRITTTSLQTWYKENYPKLKAKMPKEMQDSVLRNTQQLIQPLQFFVDEKQARSLALQVMSGYLKRHSNT